MADPLRELRTHLPHLGASRTDLHVRFPFHSFRRGSTGTQQCTFHRRALGRVCLFALPFVVDRTFPLGVTPTKRSSRILSMGGRDRDSRHRDLEGKVSMGGVGIRMGSTSIRSIHRVVEKDPNPSIYLLPSGFHIEGEVRKGQHQPLGEPGKEDMCEDPLPIQHKVQRGMNAMKKRTRERNTCTAAVWENPQFFEWDTAVSRNSGAAVDPLRNVSGFHLPTAHNACTVQ